MSGNGLQARGLQVLDRKVFPVGEKNFRDVDGGSRAYIVQSGSVDIVKEIDGKDVTVGTGGPGGIFGEDTTGAPKGKKMYDANRSSVPGGIFG